MTGVQVIYRHWALINHFIIILHGLFAFSDHERTPTDGTPGFDAVTLQKIKFKEVVQRFFKIPHFRQTTTYVKNHFRIFRQHFFHFPIIFQGLFELSVEAIASAQMMVGPYVVRFQDICFPVGLDGFVISF